LPLSLPMPPLQSVSSFLSHHRHAFKSRQCFSFVFPTEKWNVASD
jgi:hypothetical protein